MTNAVSAVRALLIYSVCIPLAIFLGYVLASPAPFQDPSTYFGVGAVLGLLLLPVALKFHHPGLILAWNTTTVIFFLPGRPNIWMTLAIVGFVITGLQYILSRRSVQPTVSLVSWPVIFFGIVVFVTMLMTGGIGFKALGAELGGGRRYAGIFAGILGYYAISMHRIPLAKANFFFGLFFLSGVTLAIGSLAQYLPSGLNFIFLLFPVDSWVLYSGEMEGQSLSTARLSSFGLAAVFAMCYMLGRYGIRGMFMSGRPWRFVIFLLIWATSLIGGYRSLMLLTAALFVIQFYLEGLHKTHLLAVFLIAGMALAAASVQFAPHLPYSFQRALSIFNLPVSPQVELDTRNSNEWRLRMWAKVTPQIPQYLLLGKGFGINVRENTMTQEMVFSRREIDSSAAAQVAQDYHNGPLSVLIPLGIFGVFGVLWFWYAGFRLLVANYRYGVPQLQSINTLLLALFVTKVLSFLLIFGSLYQDFAQFAGLLALSTALNGGMAAKAAQPVTHGAFRPRGTPTLVPQARPSFGR